MGRRVVLPLGAAVLAALASAAASGLLASDASAQVARRKDEDGAPPTLIVVPPAPRILLAGHGSHRSHSSHSSSSSGGGGGGGHASHASHRSHYSSSGGAGRGDSSGNFTDDSPSGVAPIVVERPPPPPPPPKPARVSIVAFPGGQIFLDGKLIARDVTDVLVIQPGTHLIKIVNRFVGEHTKYVEVGDGETGVITITW